MTTMTRLVPALIFLALALSACASSGYGYRGPAQSYSDGYNSYGLRQGYGNGSAD